MDKIKISTAQFEHKSGDKEYNLSVIRKLSAKASAQGAKVVSFHECSVTGYSFVRNFSKQQMLEIAEFIPDGKSISNQKKNPLLPNSHPLVSVLEATLDCSSCHSTKDKHLGLFGKDCASCHATTQWTIPAFQHPALRSTDCVQCHQAPPSHYMMHFEMVDKNIAARDKASGDACCEGVKVNQCYSCHQTTAWNDIKGIGFYKHH